MALVMPTEILTDAMAPDDFASGQPSRDESWIAAMQVILQLAYISGEWTTEIDRKQLMEHLQDPAVVQDVTDCMHPAYNRYVSDAARLTRTMNAGLDQLVKEGYLVQRSVKGHTCIQPTLRLVHLAQHYRRTITLP